MAFIFAVTKCANEIEDIIFNSLNELVLKPILFSNFFR